MDSLLANYASSDEEQEREDHQQSEKVTQTPKTSSSVFSYLPPPKSSSSSSFSLFSLPSPQNSHRLNPSQTLTNPLSSKPNNQQKEEEGGDDEDEDEEEEEQQQPQRLEDSKLPSKFRGPGKSSLFSYLPGPKSSASIFSSLPPPKSHNADPFSLANLSSTPKSNPKKVVQLRLQVNPSLMKDEDEDEDDKEREGKNSTNSLTETPSVKSFLSSIPAPKNYSSTLGALPSAAGSGRRSIIEADSPSLNSSTSIAGTEVGVNPNVGNQWVDESSSASLGDVGASAGYAVGGGGGGDTSDWVSSGANYENYDSYAGCGNYGYYGQDANNWGDGSTAMMPSDTLWTGESVVKMPGKRGRNEVPQEIVEVNQDELIKN